jgi:hypothetical protein
VLSLHFQSSFCTARDFTTRRQRCRHLNTTAARRLNLDRFAHRILFRETSPLLVVGFSSAVHPIIRID